MKTVDAFKEMINKIAAKTGLNKKLMVVLLLFFSGLCALIVSEVKTDNADSDVETAATSFADKSDEYVSALEERLVSIISAIDGAGTVRVMVTLESSSEEVYLYDSDYGEDIQPGSRNSFEQNREYVIIGDGKDEKGVVVKVVEPEIRGVAVVCDGGGVSSIKEQIIAAVTALLDISSARVSVAKMQ